MIRFQMLFSFASPSAQKRSIAPPDGAIVGQSVVPRNVLIVLPRQLGDILLGLPLAHALKSQFPDVRITWYAHPMGNLILRNHPWIDELLCYPVVGKRTKGSQNLLRWLLRLFLHAVAEVKFIFLLRSKGFDVVIDAMSNPRTALSSWLSGAPVRVSFRTRFPRTLAFTYLVPRMLLAQGYVAKARLELLSPWGLQNFEDCFALLPCSAAGAERVESFLKEHALADGRFVVCAPAHRHAVRKWPAEKFVELAQTLWLRHAVRTVWLWGPGEDAEIAALQAKTGTAGVVPPLLTLQETAWLAGRSLCFVGNSNGLSHVSVAGGAKSVQIHGPTNPENWTFPDPARHVGIQRGSGCVRCEKNTCVLARRECLEDLSVAQVIAAVEQVAGLNSGKA
jgi:ADP-heptose:LPS heptosyltransferase